MRTNVVPLPPSEARRGRTRRKIPQGPGVVLPFRPKVPTLPPPYEFICEGTRLRVLRHGTGLDEFDVGGAERMALLFTRGAALLRAQDDVRDGSVLLARTDSTETLRGRIVAWRDLAFAVQTEVGMTLWFTRAEGGPIDRNSPWRLSGAHREAVRRAAWTR